MSNLREAIIFATKAHAGQLDKVDQPYIGHPLRVMAYVLAENPRAAEAVLIAAVLHDVVEDCGVEIEAIWDLFGGEVARAVDALSKRPGEERSAYIDRCSRNRIAREVKVADIRDNSDPARKYPGSERKAAQYALQLAVLRSTT